MSENTISPAGSGDQQIVRGEIVEVDGRTLRVRLESGQIGSVTSDGGAQSGSIQVGDQASFHVVAGTDGAVVLTFVEASAVSVSEQPFDREVDQLHNALATRRPANSARSVERVHLGEEQIQDWIARVETHLGRLRKNRAKRVNEQFYTGS